MKQQLTNQNKTVIKQLISGNKKIEAIKYIRKITGFGLKDSKDIFDGFYDNLSEIDAFEYELTGEETVFEDNIIANGLKKNPLEENEINFINMLLQKGQKLNAIKYVKDRQEIGLKEAKDYIDNFDVTYQEVEEPETLILEKDDSNVITDFETPEDQSVTYENIETKKEAYDPIFKKQDSKIMTFGKVERRDKERKKTRSNSGCMLMLSFMFITGLLIATGIYLI